MKDDSHLIRLQKFIAHSGVCSRRKAEKLIAQGRVKVDGQVVTELGTKIDPRRQKVLVDGEPIDIRPDKLHYYLLNKPPGFLTTLKDPFGRPTIQKFLEGIEERVYPVGRLDKDSQGLLLLTNHGELAYRLLHPRFKVPKTYIVDVAGHPLKREIERIEKGIEIRGGIVTQPCRIRPLKKTQKSSTFEIVLREGRKRQIRYMFRAIGFQVTRLIRKKMGPLELGNLRPGEIRRLSSKEIKALLKEVGL